MFLKYKPFHMTCLSSTLQRAACIPRRSEHLTVTQESLQDLPQLPLRPDLLPLPALLLNSTLTFKMSLKQIKQILQRLVSQPLPLLCPLPEILFHQMAHFLSLNQVSAPVITSSEMLYQITLFKISHFVHRPFPHFSSQYLSLSDIITYIFLFL